MIGVGRSRHLDAVEQGDDEGAGAQRLTSASLHITRYIDRYRSLSCSGVPTARTASQLLHHLTGVIRDQMWAGCHLLEY